MSRGQKPNVFWSSSPAYPASGRHRSRRGAGSIFALIGLAVVAACVWATPAQGTPRLVVADGNTIKSIGIDGSNPREIRRVSSARLLSVSTARRTRKIAYSVRIRKLKGGYTLLRDQVWIMRGDGSHPEKVFEQVRKKNRLGLISSTPEYWGPRYGIERIELAPGGRRIMVTKEFPFVAFEVRPGHAGMRLVNPRTEGNVFGLSNPTYDHTGKRVLAYINAGEDDFGIGYVSLKSGKAKIFSRAGYDFLGTSMSASPNGRLIAVLGAAGKDEKPDDGSIRGPAAIWLINWAGERIRRINGPRPVIGPPSFPTFSPDGSRIAFKTGSYEIDRTWTVPITGGKAQLAFSSETSFTSQLPLWQWAK